MVFSCQYHQFSLTYYLPFPGKMVLLDKLLPKLKERDSRVLIFSQVSSMNMLYISILSIVFVAICWRLSYYIVQLH